MKNGILSTAIIVALLLAIWDVVIQVVSIPEYLLPAPTAVFGYLAQHWTNLPIHLGSTFLEAVLGFLLALLGGFIVATILAISNPTKVLALPAIVGMQAVPVIAVAPLLSLWIGIGLLSKVVMAALLCWFPTVINAVRGFEATTIEQRSLFTIYGASKSQIFSRLQIPQSMRFLISGARTSAGLAMIGAIVAEYTGANLGLGYLIMQSTYQLNTPELFAAILLAALSGLALSGLVGLAECTVLRRYLRN